MIKTATKVAWAFIGKFYKWGGDDPSGFDCSGLVVEILKSVGCLSRFKDLTAHGLYNSYPDTIRDSEGMLACYWNREETKVVHIEYCIGHGLTIGASGGGSRTITHTDAIEQNAYIKIRPINNQRGKVTFVDPFKDMF